jgi:hypothetical protein
MKRLNKNKNVNQKNNFLITLIYKNTACSVSYFGARVTIKLCFITLIGLLNEKYRHYKNLITLNESKSYISKQKNKFFFFEKNQDELDYCNNYGIFIHEYYDGRAEKTDGYTDGNIGDYIQNLAALQYLPKYCKPYFIDRDAVRYYYGPKVKLIMNSWHRIYQPNKYVSSQITPIFISYHIDNDKTLPSMYIEDLKKYSPIGCRDKKTRDQLIKYGVKAYFSSCLTTTLDIDYSVQQNERTNEIYFVDYNIGDYPIADKFLLSLKAYNLSESINLTHHYPLQTTNHLERFKLAKSLLNKYAKAKLVITTRIHAALPSLALHTPVILINKKYDKRFPGLYDLLNTIGINIEKKFEIKINIDNQGLVYNSNDYLKYANKLKDILKNF